MRAADCTGHRAATRAILNTLLNTPPHVDKSLYINERNNRIWQAANGLFQRVLDWSLFAGDPKKGDKPSEPGKPPKTKKEKPPEREGDKGKRKDKSPRTEELIPSII